MYFLSQWLLALSCTTRRNIQQFGASRIKHWQLRTLKTEFAEKFDRRFGHHAHCNLHSGAQPWPFRFTGHRQQLVWKGEAYSAQRGTVQVRRITVTQAITLLMWSALVRWVPELVRTNRSVVVVVLHPWPCLHSHWHALGSLLACELINNSAELLAVGWEAAQHKEHKEEEIAEPDSLFQKSFVTQMWMLASRSCESALQICLWPKNIQLK